MLAIRPVDDAAAAPRLFHVGCLLSSALYGCIDVSADDSLASACLAGGWDIEVVPGAGMNAHALGATGAGAQGAGDGDGDDASPRCEECHGQ